MSDPTFNELLVTALQSLAARPITNRKDLAAWRREADRLEESFTPEQAETVPHFVWHYLGDADIRLRNSGSRRTRSAGSSIKACDTPTVANTLVLGQRIDQPAEHVLVT